MNDGSKLTLYFMEHDRRAFQLLASPRRREAPGEAFACRGHLVIRARRGSIQRRKNPVNVSPQRRPLLIAENHKSVRVSRNTQAPLRLPGMLSTPGHCDQSRVAKLCAPFFQGMPA
jgi:hypothetical protein